MAASGEKDNLYKLVLSMVEKNNAFLDKANTSNYSKELTEITQVLKNKPNQWELNVTERDRHSGQLKTLTIKST